MLGIIMPRILSVSAIAFLWVTILSAENWPAFRGSDSRGLAEGSVATTWNADSSAGPARNIKWSTPIPGLAHSSPIIWGDRIFVTTAVSAKGTAPLRVGLYGDGDSADDNGVQRWVVLAIDKHSGKILWERTAQEGTPKTRRHTKATHANSTPVTDGKRLVTWFGSEGLYVYNLQGDLLWKKDLGTFDIGPQGYDLQWGAASSPVLVDDKIVLQCDQKKGAFLVVFSAVDGKELWRAGRDGVSNHSWSTPGIAPLPSPSGRGKQIVTNGWPYIASYDLQTGKELWRIKSAGDIPVPTPVFVDGLIYVTNAHGGPAPLYAIKPDSSGDLTGKTPGPGLALAWYEPKNGAYMQTPLILDGLLYSCSDRGVLKVYDAYNGEIRYTQRLGEGTTGFSASPIAVDGKILFTSEEGEVFVIKAGEKFELLQKNQLGEVSMASPAVSENVLYYRTRSHLIAIGK
jgi:outer membrane protein assembly factor BamB